MEATKNKFSTESLICFLASTLGMAVHARSLPTGFTCSLGQSEAPSAEKGISKRYSSTQPARCTSSA